MAKKNAAAEKSAAANTTEAKATVKVHRAQKPAPTTAPAPEAAKAEAPKAKKEPKASKFISRDQFLGRNMRVAEYQDYTFAINDQPNRHLTDEELCADWQKQFPNAVKFETFHVRGARRDFNNGLHSKAYTGKHESVPYAVVDGKRVKAAYTRAAKATAAKPGEAAQPVATAADKATAAKKAATVAVRKKTVAA